jgi:hypothetical protein
MESFEPYKVIARTGRFCLGFPQKEQQNEAPKSQSQQQQQSSSSSRTMTTTTTNTTSNTSSSSNDETEIIETKNPYIWMNGGTLRIRDGIYDKCPRIHFVSGIAQHVDDNNKFIISYGINDCVPHFIVLDKRHITQLLFTPEQLVQ